MTVSDLETAPAWPKTMGAPATAPASHHALPDNDQVRVLEVVIEAGAREPEHTRQSASVVIIDEPARIRRCVGGALEFESPARSGFPPGADALDGTGGPGWRKPATVSTSVAGTG